ncbi:MAG: lipid-A-disaccharide synthase [Alphaproteobacteria bacterium]|jgi:lipid-A-disaccharide synthase|nr:lipid-A-disaccharide synthase [Alphaproteobacteria bacterium]
MTRALEVSIIAGEESGDRLGAPLMRALAARYDGRVNFSGVGGREMSKEGLVSLFPIDDLAIMGFAAIVRRVPLIVRRMRETVAAIITARPDVLVIIDSPDFTHRVARKVRAAMPSIPIVDYVSPSVWAWRPWRARSMRAYVDHILALLPFEPAVHTRLGGPACSYVGHPLVESASALRPNAEEAARRFADPPVLLVLPGSRTGEVRRLLSIFAQTIDLIRRRYGPLEIVIPTVPHLLATIREATAAWPVPPRIVMDAEEKHAAFRMARAALTKSGTVTLELAVAGVPMVAAYKVSAIEAAIARRLIQVSSAILANLVVGENVVPEFLQTCTGENLAAALLPLLSDTPERRQQIEAFARLDSIMEIGMAVPSTRAAEIVLREAMRGRA